MFQIGTDTTARVERALIAGGHRNANVELRKAEFVGMRGDTELHVVFMWSIQRELYGVTFVVINGDPENGYHGNYVGSGCLALWPDIR
jgi:hypothetical protein